MKIPSSFGYSLCSDSALLVVVQQKSNETYLEKNRATVAVIHAEIRRAKEILHVEAERLRKLAHRKVSST